MVAQSRRTVARAQVQRGNLALSVDTSLFNWQYGKYERLEGITGSAKERAWGIGPLDSVPSGGVPGYAALSIGYVGHRHIVPGLQLSYGVVSHQVDQETFGRDTHMIYSFMARPVMEVPVNPSARMVVSGVAGVDLRWFKRTVETEWEHSRSAGALRAYGPVFGMKLHAFLNEWCSFDLSAAYTELIMRERQSQAGFTDFTGRKYRGRTIGLTMGISVWL